MYVTPPQDTYSPGLKEMASTDQAAKRPVVQRSLTQALADLVWGSNVLFPPDSVSREAVHKIQPHVSLNALKTPIYAY
jgi:hypothetical protein